MTSLPSVTAAPETQVVCAPLCVTLHTPSTRGASPLPAVGISSSSCRNHLMLNTSPCNSTNLSFLVLRLSASLSQLVPSNPLTSGGGPTGLTILSSSCTLVFSLGWPIPMLMYCSSGGWPTYEDSESRAMFDVHSCLVVSAEPMPMKRAWRASSCCWARSLSAMVCGIRRRVGGLLGVGRVDVDWKVVSRKTDRESGLAGTPHSPGNR
jgi:hypothetical protein